MESFSVAEVGVWGRANEPASFFPPEWKWKSSRLPVDRDTTPCHLYFHLEFSTFHAKNYLAKNSYLPLHANERLHRVVDVLAFRFFALYLTPSDNQLINFQFSYSNSFQKRRLVKLQVTKRSRKNRSWFTHRSNSHV